jgi:hypothetical protein
VKVHRISRNILVVALLLGLSGCASTKVIKSPKADLKTLKKFYVVKWAEDTKGINLIIVDQLNILGFKATTGNDQDAIDADVDALVTYQDYWMWDITTYLLRLNLQIRHPKTNAVLAQGESYRPSLQRKHPGFMTREILEGILPVTK